MRALRAKREARRRGRRAQSTLPSAQSSTAVSTSDSRDGGPPVEGDDSDKVVSSPCDHGSEHGVSLQARRPMGVDDAVALAKGLRHALESRDEVVILSETGDSRRGELKTRNHCACTQGMPA